MRVVYMGKHKRSAVAALDHLVTAGAEVAAVLAPGPDARVDDSQRLDLAAGRHGLRLVTEDELYADAEAGALGEIDLVVSFLFWNRIREPLISLGSIGCLNFHPAPLPDMRGLGGYNVAIFEEFTEWGVSCHFVDAEFDTGDLVRVDRFPLDHATVTPLALDIESQGRLVGVFEWVIEQVAAGTPLPRTPQADGRYVDRAEFEALRRVQPGDDAATIARRIRAFWYPPHPGATVELAGETFTLVDAGLLETAAEANRLAGLLP